MINIFQEIGDDNPNDFKLGGKIRFLNETFEHKYLQMLCEKYPNDQMLGEEFRKFLNKLK
jgi:hypothetical protein